MPQIPALLATLVAALVLGAGESRPDEARIERIRQWARPAEQRLVSGPEGDALRARVAELDRAFQQYPPAKGMTSVQAFRTLPTSAELDGYREWIERARPVLATWVRIEPCEIPAATVAASAGELLPVRELIEVYWDQGQRIAVDPPRLKTLRQCANLLAWRACFDAEKPHEQRETCELAPADILASTITLAYAFDDSSLIGTLARIAIEEHTLRVARLMLDQRIVTATEMRCALEPCLARAAAVEPRETIEGELRAFLSLYDRVASDGIEATDYFASAGEAFDLADRPAQFLGESPRDHEDAFLQSCRSALSRVHRHRSIVAVFRVVLALMEYRERKGTLPRELAELAPAFHDKIPIDPITGASLSYRLEDERARVCPITLHVEWNTAVEQMLAWELSLR